MVIGVLTVQAAKEHVLCYPEVPSGQRNREQEKRSLCWWDVLQRSVSKQNKIAGSESEGQFHCFLQFPQVNFNVSEKDGSKDIASKKCQIRA